MKMAAIYARVSSERQKEDQTIASQVAALIEHAQNEGYSIPEEWIFQDEGYSGAMLVRPGLERLRDLASEGQIETLLIYSPDRLSRKYAYPVLLVEEFSRHGVDVVFVKSAKANTPEEELLLQFQGMIAEYERAQIAERTRRGKKHRARAGSVNVLSGAPYGYRYVKKTDSSSAYYELIEKEAEVVRAVFGLYTEDGLSVNAIARWLNDQQVSTRRRISRWERSTVWGMLRNPAYMGMACFGKTERAQRQRITRPLRRKGGFSARCSSNRERPREEWMEIGVPAIVSDETFALAQERLEQNKRFSPRRTIEPTLLQGMLVCGECGYAYYRTSTRTSKRKLYYYRCLGSDDYRYPGGRVCSNQPVRQDYLDGIVWKQVVQLLEQPDLIRSEIQRRLKEIQDSNPTTKRKEVLIKEMARARKSIERLLDAYQENLLDLEELRKRMPELRKREKTLGSELQSLEVAAADHQTFLRLAENIENFLCCLRKTAETMYVTERQKLLRLVVKEIQVDRQTIKIKHSIPAGGTVANPPPNSSVKPEMPSYLLRSWSAQSLAGQSTPGRVGPGIGTERTPICSLCRRL
jgi:site-specific DNA recombinase